MDHLSLHVMVRALDTPDKQDLRKLQLLKDELVSYVVVPQHLSLGGEPAHSMVSRHVPPVPVRPFGKAYGGLAIICSFPWFARTRATNSHFVKPVVIGSNSYRFKWDTW